MTGKEVDLVQREVNYTLEVEGENYLILYQIVLFSNPSENIFFTINLN